MEWSKDDPKTDGVYWWRADRLDFEPDIHSVVVGRFYQIGEMHSCEVEGFGGEWLGPVAPEQAEQFDALRKAATGLLAAIDRADYGVDVYSLAPNLRPAATALRRALGKEQ